MGSTPQRVSAPTVLDGRQPIVDVVVVAYNSANELRDAVAPLAGRDRSRVIVVDNASTDDSLERVADLDVTTLRNPTNAGFAAGCNAGWRAGDAPCVCFLNPDASLEGDALDHLVSVLAAEPQLGLVAPRIEKADGCLVHSVRRFPRARSTFARALFLHRLFPTSSWVDDVIQDRSTYERPGSPDWVSGACVVVRRSALESVGGWDEGFFLYGEDIDLCRRLRDAGWGIRFEPSVTARHLGGRSAPRAALLPVLARSRLRYARKHGSRSFSVAVRAGVALGALTHVVVARGGASARRGHLGALAVALGLGSRATGPR